MLVATGPRPKGAGGNLALRFISTSKPPVFSLVRTTSSDVYPLKRKPPYSPRPCPHPPLFRSLKKNPSTQVQGYPLPTCYRSPFLYSPISTVLFLSGGIFRPPSPSEPLLCDCDNPRRRILHFGHVWGRTHADARTTIHPDTFAS